MEKRVRIYTGKRFVIGLLVSFAIFTAAIFWVTAAREMKPFLRWICLLSAPFLVWENVYWADCSKNEICVTRLGIFKRRISAERISSIQLVAWKNRYQSQVFVVICLDGHRPCNSGNLWVPFYFTLWSLSPKVIAIRILEYQYKQYIQKLTKLYGRVTLDRSFRDWRRTQNKKSRKKRGLL